MLSKDETVQFATALHSNNCLEFCSNYRGRTLKTKSDTENRAISAVSAQKPCAKIHIYYLPAGRSVLGKTVLEASGRTQDRGHGFSQYGPT